MSQNSNWASSPQDSMVMEPSRQAKMSEVYNLVKILSEEISELQSSSYHLKNGLMGPEKEVAENNSKPKAEPLGHLNILIDRLEAMLAKVRITNKVLYDIHNEITAPA